MVTQQKKRISRKYYSFFGACLVSLVGLLIYILARHKIPFPHQWLPKVSQDDNLKVTKLFFTGISIHLQVNFALGLIFMFLKLEKMDRVKVQKWKFWITRSLIFVASLIWGLGRYWGAVKPEGVGGWGNVLLLSLIITIINCCLLELLIQLMNQYGICNAFNLILLTEFLPLLWLKENWSDKSGLVLAILFLSLLTIFFVWLTNLKWEVPVETNMLYNQDQKSFVKSRSTLGFKLNFSFMPLIYLSSLLSFIWTLTIMRGNTNWTSWTSIVKSWNDAGTEKLSSSENLTKSKNSFSSLFKLNENKHIFDWKNLANWIKEKKWIIIGALLFLILLRWLAVWLQMSKQQWNSKEVSKDLRQRGIYINQISPGKVTRNLLKKIVNKLVIFWLFLILVFNIIFDNIFAGTSLVFLGWFGGVNIGIEIIRQIRTKYKYIRN